MLSWERQRSPPPMFSSSRAGGSGSCQLATIITLIFSTQFPPMRGVLLVSDLLLVFPF